MTINRVCSYETKRWRKFREASCYSYALNHLTNNYMLVGDYLSKQCKANLRCTRDTSNKVLLRTLKKELRLVFQLDAKIVPDINYPLKNNQRMLYLHRNIDTGLYHFLRRDKQDELDEFGGQRWSHKYPGCEPENTYENGEFIEDPENLSDAFKCWCIVLTPLA